MPAFCMGVMAMRLQRRGFDCRLSGYSAVSSGLEVNAHRLAAFIDELAVPCLSVVGHSLGGVVALHAIERYGLTQVKRLVMLGCPYRDSYAARYLARVRLGRRLLGRTTRDWLALDKPPAPRGTEVGVIAGTREFGIGMLVARGLPTPHDGLIRVAETKVDGMADFASLHVCHSSMPFSPLVCQVVERFLRQGRFQSEPESAVASPIARPSMSEEP
jgi:pimeloyl-ACP methyl ester carboxylesterase